MGRLLLVSALVLHLIFELRDSFAFQSILLEQSVLSLLFRWVINGGLLLQVFVVSGLEEFAAVGLLYA